MLYFCEWMMFIGSFRLDHVLAGGKFSFDYVVDIVGVFSHHFQKVAVF